MEDLGYMLWNSAALGFLCGAMVAVIVAVINFLDVDEPAIVYVVAAFLLAFAAVFFVQVLSR